MLNQNESITSANNIFKGSTNMFHSIPNEVKERMDFLSKIDLEDRTNGTARLSRLRQIPRETGKFISLLFSTVPEGTAIEIGTSGGYSTLWLSLVCREQGKKVFTFELLEEKIKLAEETFKIAKVDDIVELVKGDALENIKNYSNISFCFLDAEKEIYSDCYEAVITKMVKGGLLIADNAMSHYDSLKPFINRVLEDNRVDAMVVPIGTGELVCKKL